MPKTKIDGKIKHFPYTKAGYKAAAKAKKKKVSTSDGYMKV